MTIEICKGHRDKNLVTMTINPIVIVRPNFCHDDQKIGHATKNKKPERKALKRKKTFVELHTSFQKLQKLQKNNTFYNTKVIKEGFEECKTPSEICDELEKSRNEEINQEMREGILEVLRDVKTSMKGDWSLFEIGNKLLLVRF